MRLKSLELIGFKSFVDRTVIEFDQGITSIVGPNGAGKSNCVDAIRWVMGEQSAKHLRGDQMQDVIFNGSETRAPLGMASVFLTFDNSDGRAPAEYADYTEITVGRRLYRSGESEYYINKTPCRLKDIVDLFLGTGTGTKAYSIVEQGRIGQIVTSRPEERRFFIEETAGISKVKHRKEAALLKMVATRANIERLRDLIAELERQLGNLARQAKKAERYREYQEELKAVELACAAHQWIAWRGELSEVEARLAAAAEQEAGGAATLSEREATLETSQLELAALEREVTKLQETAYALQNTIHLHEAEIQRAESGLAEAAAFRRAEEGAIETIEAQRTQWQRELADANSAKVAADLSMATAAERVSANETAVQAATVRQAEGRRQEEEAQQALIAGVRAISERQAGMEQVTRRKTETTAALRQAEERTAIIENALARLQTRIGEGQGALAGRRQLRLHLEAERGMLEAELAAQRTAAEGAAAEAEQLSATLQSRRARWNTLDEMTRNFAGYDDGVRALLQARPAGILGTVAQMLTTEPRFEAALGAALGERLQSVVVASHADGIAAIDYLKEAAAGRSAFIPLAVRTDDRTMPLPTDAGVVGPLDDFVQWDDAAKTIGHHLLRGVIVVEDRASAIRLWERDGHFATLVTLDGEVIHPSGELSGGVGASGAAALLTSQREIETLKVEVAQLTTAEQVAKRSAADYAERVGGLQTRLDQLRQEAHAGELEAAHQQREAEHLASEVARHAEERATAAAEVSRLKVAVAQLVADGTEIEEALAATLGEQAQREAAISEQKRVASELAERFRILSDELIQAKVALAAAAERVITIDREVERLLTSSAEAVATIERKRVAIAEGELQVEASRQTISSRREALHTLVKEAAAAKARREASQARFQELMEMVRTREMEIREIRRTHEAARTARHEAELHVAQQRERMAFCRREIQDKYRIVIDERPEQYCPADFEPVSAMERLAALREKVERLGGVNPDAIREYDELKARHDFLTEQSADLTASLEALHRAIQKINRVSRERFRETFEAINAHFTQLFPKLFRGGKARLELTDEENLLEAGVEIVAQPPGKKLQSVTLLSGGEKALTAVAMIFAMFLTRPSPFCLLDEVDAPLDDANIDRFNDLIREMTAYSQFILITHNKRTMELADVLYGVTMEEAGVSKLVSVRLSQDAAAAAA
ncbi:MAG: chromosome segregation protein SMC [Deltaproteobacteria bacterium]|nr:chromosome segregation protein SMC [Deltaproteobacteria bacterium]